MSDCSMNMFEAFVEGIYTQALELMPEDIDVGDKEYIATTMKHFAQTSIEALSDTYNDVDMIKFIVQVVTEWTFHKGLDIVRAGIPKELWDTILQNIAFAAYQVCKDNLKKEIKQETLVKIIETNVKKEFHKTIDSMYSKQLISKENLQKAKILSNIDGIKNADSLNEQDAGIENCDSAKNCNEGDFRDNIQQDYASPNKKELEQMKNYKLNYWKNCIKNEPYNPEGYINFLLTFFTNS